MGGDGWIEVFEFLDIVCAEVFVHLHSAEDECDIFSADFFDNGLEVLFGNVEVYSAHGVIGSAGKDDDVGILG